MKHNGVKTLKEYREERELTQQQVASILGVTVTYISLVENGKRNVSDKTKKKFAQLYKCNVVDIFSALQLTRS